MLSMLATAINSTFERECKKHQLQRGPSAADVFKVSFSIRTDYSKEEGYRYLEVVFWAPMNYVQVWVRETWDVIAIEDMEFDGEGDGRPKPGKDYQKGASEWVKVYDHDSGWREAIRNILRDNESRIVGFGGQDHFWRIEPAAALPFTGLSR